MGSVKKRKISVIIPVYNAETFLEKCLKSVIKQTLKDIEIICIDDGSTDKSWDVLNKFAKIDNRIIAIRQQNQGAAVARNKGLEIASGEYVGFVDSDDYVDKDYFEKLYKTAKNEEADIAVAYVKSEFENGDLKHYMQVDSKSYDNHYNRDTKKATLKNKLKFQSVIWLSIYSRQMLSRKDIYFVPRLRTGQDHIFNLQASYHANQIVYVSEKTYYHRVAREGSLMTHFNYTEKGLLSRSHVIFESIRFLNSVPDYDKSFYITRIVDSIAFFYSRLTKTKVKSSHVKHEISNALVSSWVEMKYKKEIQTALTNMIDSEFIVALSNPRRLRKYITRIHSPAVILYNKINGNKDMTPKIFIKRFVKALTPFGILVVWRKYLARKRNRLILNFCPICETESEFLPVRSTGGTRQKANCPNCKSYERHRVVWLFLNRKLGFSKLKNKSMLHIAAERMFEPRFRSIVGKGYKTADFLKKADIKMDITDIKHRDNSFDIIMCSHVLEHVSDDTKAMRELYRVLKPGGWAIFLVPIADMPNTYENKRIKTDTGRLKHFGQTDHVRKYGRDYINRLKSAGWNVDIYKAQDIANKKEIKRMHLIEDAEKWGFTPTEIFFCTKQ